MLMDLHHSSRELWLPSETAGKWDIRINSDFSSELLLDFAELDGIWRIVGDEVEKAYEGKG